MADGASPTRHSSRERVPSTKARGSNMRRSISESSEMRDTIEVGENGPAAPQSKWVS